VTPGAPYVCPYCRTASGGSAPTCPACGAPLDVALKTTPSGWIELPPARDMVHIQCGRSSLQIAGAVVPAAEFTLAPGDGVFFGHHELLWKEPSVTVTQRGLKGAWKRMLAGLPVHLLDAVGPGRIAFSRDAAGETLAIPLHGGAAVDVREHLFLAATHAVAYNWMASDIWFQTGTGSDRETHHPIGLLLDRFSASAGPGLLLVHAHGNAFVRQLAPGEPLYVKPSAFLYKDPSVQIWLHFNRPRGGGPSFWSWGERYMWLGLKGPGRIAIQSAHGHVHDPGGRLTGGKYTMHQW